jgi:tRNA (cytidine/uridine-2'-O-)-methyltransferase
MSQKTEKHCKSEQIPDHLRMPFRLHVVLYQPEIPPNTGNVIRLCANTGAKLHLIEPLGFNLNDRDLRRAGLDYHEWVDVKTYPNLDTFVDQVQPGRLLAFSTKNSRFHTDIVYTDNDALLFGPETRGLPTDILDALPPDHRLRIPLRPNNRSLNLSNAVAIGVFEAWRQHRFAGGQ